MEVSINALLTTYSNYYSIPLCSFLQILQMKEKVSHLHFLPQKTPLLFRKHLLHQLKKYKISYYQDLKYSHVYSNLWIKLQILQLCLSFTLTKSNRVEAFWSVNVKR